MRVRRRGRAVSLRRAIAGKVSVAVLIASAATSLAQVPPVLGPTPTPTSPPPPTATPPPTPAPEPTPTPDPVVPPLEPTPTPGPSSSPGQSPTPSTAPPDALSEESDHFGRIPPGFTIPSYPRTPGRNTAKLVGILEEVTRVGMSLEDALVQGMGRFPVGGLAWYSDDWQFPRFTPYFHLHEGLDIFADFGTPIRSPDRGVVTRVVDGPVGGIAVWVRGSDGTLYYFAHMQEVASGVEPGRSVDVGTVLGRVGDSGNARGGAPHMHFEVHKPNVVPPKPVVDAWLAQAELDASVWVEARIRAVLEKRTLLRTEQSLSGLLAADLEEPSATPEYSILLTLLDPVGGSVGLLPRLSLVPANVATVSPRLLDQLVRLRVDGHVLGSVAGSRGPDGGG